MILTFFMNHYNDFGIVLFPICIIFSVKNKENEDIYFIPAIV